VTEGSASQTFGFSFVIDANGDYLVDANGDQVIVNDPGNIDQIATGASLGGGFASQTIAAFTQTATGVGLGAGAASQSIADVTQAATGQRNVLGAAAQTIGDVGQLSTGDEGDSFPIPEDITSPAISGQNRIHGSLTCSTGTWGDAVVLSYTYQWRREGVDIDVVTSGANTNTYLVRLEDAGKTLACRVTAITAETTLTQLSNELRIDTFYTGSASLDVLDRFPPRPKPKPQKPKPKPKPPEPPIEELLTKFFARFGR
jgi:hypothetical protein